LDSLEESSVGAGSQAGLLKLNAVWRRSGVWVWSIRLVLV
jgi:hypothetical protein